MSSGSWMQADVRCPFYRHDDGSRIITCDGVIPDSDTKSRFPTRAARQNHMKLFCCDGYKTCEVYLAVMQRYEEE